MTDGRNRPRVAVVGAGAAGISAAFWLRRAGGDPVVLERAGAVGGRARTVRQDGFCIDLGAGALASGGTHTLRLVRALGLEGELHRVGAVVGLRADGPAGTVHHVERRRPWTLASFDALDTRSKLSLWRLGTDLARMSSSIDAADLSAAARFDTRTVHDYVTGRYPALVRDHLIEPLTRARFLVEPEQTSVVDLFTLVKNFLLPGHLLAHPDGVAFFLERAAARLDVRTGCAVTAVHEDPTSVAVTWTEADGADRTERFDGCVLAVPTATLLDIHPGLDGRRRDYLRSLDYSTSVMVHLGLRTAPPEPAGVVLFPRATAGDLATVGLGHNLAPGRTPSGAGIVTAYWMTDWSRQHLDDEDDDHVSRTLETLARHFPSWPLEVVTSVVARWDPAMVASRPGTFRGLAAYTALSRADRRIQVAGDFLSQTTVDASVAAGEVMALRLLRALRA